MSVLVYFTSYYFPHLDDRMAIQRLNVRGSLESRFQSTNNIATLTPVGFMHTEDTSEGDVSSPANGTTVIQIADIVELPSHSRVQKIGV